MHKQAGVRCLQVTGDAVGGIRLHVHTVVDALLRENIPVFYTCSLYADLKGSQEIVDFEQKGIPVLRLAVKKRPAFSDFINILKVWCFARKHKINLIHGHGAKGGLYARLAGFLLGAKVVYTPHGGVVHAAFGRMTTRIYALIERVLIPFTSMYVFESKYTQVEFLKLINKKSLPRAVVNYNGISFKEKSFQMVFPHEGFIPSILVVGMLRWEKGQDVVLHALSILKSRGFFCEAHFCGDGPSRAELCQLSTGLALDDRVSFHGDVSDLRPFFERATLVVIPSRFESFGYVALEAAQYARVVLASRVGGLCEVIVDGETGVLFESENVEDLANNIQRVIMDSDCLSRMAGAALSRGKSMFSVQQMLDGLMNVYQ